jgi:membrane protease YdiL (CAAX protease family)
MLLSLAVKGLLLSLYLTATLWIFALFINSSFPLNGIAIVGLILSAYCMSEIHVQNRQAALHATLWQWRTSWVGIMLIALSLSLMLSVLYRLSIQLPAIPTRLRGFVIISVLIGCCEELVFRGFVQGAAHPWNAKAAIALGALSHAGYKALLFVLPQQLIDTPVQNLFAVTFVAGLALGYTRYRSGSLWPCILGHAFFDVWVYGEQSSAPWWVW